MHGPTCTFWADLTPLSLQYHPSFYDVVFECLFLGGGVDAAKADAGGGVEPMLLPLAACLGGGGGGVPRAE
jgi:hypothetical protein